MSKDIFRQMAILEEKLSWTVHPTEPLLPPEGKLIKVVGTIERIYAEKHERDFSPENYVTVEYETNRTSVLNSLASILSAFNGQIGMLASAGKGRVVLETKGYFTYVQIDGVVYRGWIGACPFKVGDHVELAASCEEDHFELYAIARPMDKMISICPKCIKGKKEYIKELILEIINIFFWLLIFFNFILFISKSKDSFLENFSVASIFVFFLVGFYYTLRIHFEYNTLFNTNVKLAQQIFETLGFKSPEKVNLKKMTKKRLKEIYQQTGIKLKPNQIDAEKQPMLFNYWSVIYDCHLFYYE